MSPGDFEWPSNDQPESNATEGEVERTGGLGPESAELGLEPEYSRLQHALELAEESIKRHPLIAASVVDTFMTVSLAQAKEASVDVSKILDFETRVKALQERAPAVEVGAGYQSGRRGNAGGKYRWCKNVVCRC